MSKNFNIYNDYLTVSINEKGAELVSLKDKKNKEWLWQAGPEWARHSPVLFPIVGKLKNNTARIAEKDYTIPQHGFARDLDFSWAWQGRDGCSLVLTDSEETRKDFPFPFFLELAYMLDGAKLTVHYKVKNTGKAALPVSLGAHPAFRWPLDDNSTKTDHTLVFENDETAPVKKLKNGLLQESDVSNPVKNRTLSLSDSLFTDDVIIFENPASSSVIFKNTQGTKLTVSWEGFKQLGLWMKPGANFLCIEPWAGYASPEQFSGDFSKKPGLLLLPPDEEFKASWSVELDVPAAPSTTSSLSSTASSSFSTPSALGSSSSSKL
ncbi:aldose 1-epimerase family protein [Entomobacter blattae]|uniref:Protein LacX, plasmid n=1 Tax=Entomobacter blattae TaxID=2762277 RepID=A0A7H1NQ13_9PROT|nr:aldose 1-epimerase family protein [Entomobacter blattae]QNT77873.1 Protein LacX, plasmid [Entomobacter blattae]